MRDPSRLAFHYLGCAVERDDGVWVPGRVGALIDCFAELGDQVTVLAYDPPDPPPLEDKTEYRLNARNVTFCSLGPKGSLVDIRSRRRRVREVVRAQERWDAMILKLPNRRVGPVVDALDGVPTIPILVGHTPSVVATARWPLWRRAFVYTFALIAERTYRRILRRSATTFVNSEELRQRYADAARHIEIVPLSSRRKRFAYEAQDRMDGEHLNLAITGRITAEKGVFEALEAFAMLRADGFATARLHVIGAGSDMDALLARSAELGVSDGIVTHGWLPVGEELFSRLREMDVLLLPSYAEGLPYAVLEAMAHSVLVVCTPVGGLKAAFAHDREVLFVPVQDASAVAQAVRRLAADPALRRRLLRTAYANAEPKNLDAVAGRMLGTAGPEHAR